MSTRRDFLMVSAGLAGAAVPLLGRSQALPCPPPQLSAGAPDPTATTCTRSNMPAYIGSMVPFQVRSLSGSFAPSNGTSTLRSVLPPMWAGNDDIMRPWSGGAKSTSGSSCLCTEADTPIFQQQSHQFRFLPETRGQPMALENSGQTGVSSTRRRINWRTHFRAHLRWHGGHGPRPVSI